MSENKCVIILNENLPLGQLVNSAAYRFVGVCSDKIHLREVTDA